MNQIPKITLCIIVKNEEKYLRECLESVKDIADEIVLADTGSTDNTVDIAREFNAEIHHFKWIDDFSAARNFALGKCTGSWILYLDADERLSGNSLNELKNIAGREELLGCRCLVKSVNESNGKPNFMMYTRLFRNSPNLKFTGKVHEQIDESLIANGYKIEDTAIEIIHIGYNIPGKALEQKAKRNLKLLIQEFEKNKSSYNAWQIANTYSVLEDHERANQYYQLAVKDEDLNKSYKAFAFMNLAAFEFKKHNLNQAAEYLG
ncbi:MAG TPA: glycosyltransferase family 2 protein, partial [Ignavibacteriaceae bacterium]|nr:glycosyltransferase family 2 protein [Ignavibacteriaceae bacterium]